MNKLRQEGTNDEGWMNERTNKKVQTNEQMNETTNKYEGITEQIN